MNKFFILAIFGVVAAFADQCPTAKSKCSDDNTSCAGWAQNGQCKANPDYMTKFCSKSCCTICDSDAPTGNLKCPTDASKCVENKNKSCEAWAAYDDKGLNSECDSNPAYMIRNCQASCCDNCKYGADKCPVVKSACGNTFPKPVDKTPCDVEVTRKACPKCKEDDFTEATCKKNLDLAGATDKNRAQRLACVEHKRCVELTAAKKKANDQCTAWADAGECTKNPKYMNKNCNDACCPTCTGKVPTPAPRRVIQQPRIIQQPRVIQQPIYQQPVQYVQSAPVRQPVQYVQAAPVRAAPVARTPVVRAAPVTTLPYTTPAFGSYGALPGYNAFPQQILG